MKPKELLIFTGLAFLMSCNQGKYQELAEQEIETTYNSKFSTFSKNLNDSSINVRELYQKIEYYYLFTGLLKSQSKSDYKSFHAAYVVSDTTVNLDCLYLFYPYSESLVLPSNLGHNFYSFENGVSKYADKLDEESQLLRAYRALLLMKSGMDLKFEDSSLFDNYIDAVEAIDFENKIIYRMPIIAFSHLILAERAQFKKNNGSQSGLSGAIRE